MRSRAPRHRWRVLPFIALSIAAATAAAQNAPTTQATPPPDISVFQLFLKGGFFMYPLAFCSILAIGIIFERFAALAKKRVLPPNFIPGLRAVFKDPQEDRDAALTYCKSHDSPLARILAAGVRRLPRGWSATEKAIEDEGGNQTLRLRHNMRLLYALGSVATLLGLIGTISGMIKAFQVAAVAGVGRVDQLSTGIYEAMTCTFAGLAVAVVVTLFYYYFMGRIERLVGEMNDTVNQFADAYGINDAEKQVQDEPEMSAAIA